MDLSIVIINFRTFELTINCIRSIQENISHLQYEIILVDNAPGKENRDTFQQLFPDLVYIYSQENIGFGRANNLGIEAARGKYILLINSDTLVIDRSIEECFRFMEQSSSISVGLLGCKLLNEDRSYQNSFFPFTKNSILNYLLGNNQVLYKLSRTGQKYNEPQEVKEVGDVSGAFMFLRREVVLRVGAFDPDFFLYCEETEWCRERIARHFKIVYYPSAQIIHYGGKSAPKEPMLVQSRLSLALMWYKKGWANYILFIVASYANVLMNACTWPFVNKEVRKLIRDDLKCSYKVLPYLFIEIPKYRRDWGSRKKPLIYEGARTIFFGK